jgi:hypothetical protein
MTFRRADYHPDFPAVSKALRAIDGRSEGRCECVGECGSAHGCGSCGAPNHVEIVRHRDAPEDWRRVAFLRFGDHGEITDEIGPGWRGRPVRVVLTVAHLPGHLPMDPPDLDRLRAMCQRCHLLMDRRERRRAKASPGPGS